MIKLTADHLSQLETAGERAYPGECCGLLVGRKSAAGAPVWTVARIEESDNLAARDDRFEVDPALQIRLQRDLRDSEFAVIGVYHSHPDGHARPSDHDLGLADDPDMVWLVTAVKNGAAARTTAHIPAPGGSAFTEIELVIAADTHGGAKNT